MVHTVLHSFRVFVNVFVIEERGERERGREREREGGREREGERGKREREVHGSKRRLVT